MPDSRSPLTAPSLPPPQLGVHRVLLSHEPLLPSTSSKKVGHCCCWPCCCWSLLLLVTAVAGPAVVVVGPQLVCPSKPALLRKSKQLAGECHRSRGLLMLCCALIFVSAGQWVIICVRLWVPVLQCVQTSSTESSILCR